MAALMDIETCRNMVWNRIDGYYDPKEFCDREKPAVSDKKDDKKDRTDRDASCDARHIEREVSNGR